MNKIYVNNNRNKFGYHSLKHNLDICKHHKLNNDLVQDKPEEKETGCHLDITEIYTHKAVEIVETVETKNIRPKLLAVVQLAVSKAKLDQIIGKKKW